MDKVVIQGDELWWAGKRIGPASNIYAYPGERSHLCKEGVEVCQTPNRIDLLFTAGERVVGCEVKQASDLVSSHRSRRLHRQLATLIKTVAVPCLVVRGLDNLGARVMSVHPKPEQFWADWVNWQTRGIYILPVPMEDYLPRLLAYRAALATTGTRALAGTDQRPARDEAEGWLLRRIPGIGAVKSAALLAEYGSSFDVFNEARQRRVAAKFGKSIQEKLWRAMTT